MFYICNMKKKTIYTILAIIISLFTLSCEQEKPKATSKEKTEDKTPTETPAERTEDKTPEERTEDKTPEERTEDKTPEETTEDKTPEERTEDKTSEERTEDKTPEDRTEDKTPEETPKTAGDYIQEAKDEKAKGNDREAEEALNEAIRLSDSDEARRLRSEIYLINKQYDEVYEDASKAIELDANNILNYENRLQMIKVIINDLRAKKTTLENVMAEKYDAGKDRTKEQKEYNKLVKELLKYMRVRESDKKEIKKLKT